MPWHQAEESDYQNGAERHVCELSEKALLQIVPMTKEGAVEYWNMVNKHDKSDWVKAHFCRCLRDARY